MAEKKEALGKKEAHGEDKPKAALAKAEKVVKIAETEAKAEKAVATAEKDVKTEKVEKAEPVHDKKEAPKAEASKKGKPKDDKKKAEKVDIVSETVYTIPFSDVYRTRPMYKRANKAIAFVRFFLTRHTKATEVVVDGALNRHIWARGCSKPPRRVQVKAVKDSKGRVTAMLLK